MTKIDRQARVDAFLQAHRRWRTERVPQMRTRLALSETSDAQERWKAVGKALTAAHPFPRASVAQVGHGAEWWKAYAALLINQQLTEPPLRIGLPAAGTSPDHRFRAAKRAIEAVATAAEESRILSAFPAWTGAVAASHAEGKEALAAAQAEAGRRREAALRNAQEHVAALPPEMRLRAQKLLGEAMTEPSTSLSRGGQANPDRWRTRLSMEAYRQEQEPVAPQLAAHRRRDEESGDAGAPTLAEEQQAIDCRPLAEQLGLRVKVACDPYDSYEAYERFVDTLGEVLEALPENDRELLAARWRAARPTAALVSQMERGARSHHDPDTGGFRFAWGEVAHLSRRLLRAALAHELAHAVNALRGERHTEDAALRLSMSWGHLPFPR